MRVIASHAYTLFIRDLITLLSKILDQIDGKPEPVILWQAS